MEQSISLGSGWWSYLTLRLRPTCCYLTSSVFTGLSHNSPIFLTSEAIHVFFESDFSARVCTLKYRGGWKNYLRGCLFSSWWTRPLVTRAHLTQLGKQFSSLNPLIDLRSFLLRRKTSVCTLFDAIFTQHILIYFLLSCGPWPLIVKCLLLLLVAPKLLQVINVLLQAFKLGRRRMGLVFRTVRA